MVVANDPWQKSPFRAITPADTRLALVEALVAGSPGVVADATEITLGGHSITARTLDYLSSREPTAAWAVIVGADALRGLSTWRDVDGLVRSASFVVVNRTGAANEEALDRVKRELGPELAAAISVEFVDIPTIDVSSSDIRARIAAGKSVRHLVGGPVDDQIARLGLYRDTSNQDADVQSTSGPHAEGKSAGAVSDTVSPGAGDRPTCELRINGCNDTAH